jgi:mannose-1-phosphate guanylyltransferase/mannose-6-phosphate isomerase
MNKFVILSGGAGTRLWPFSRTHYPKQFFDLTNSGRPMLLQTVDRLLPFGQVSVLTTDLLRIPTRGLLDRFERNAVEVIVEPAARNTAAPIALAVYEAFVNKTSDVLAFFPADHQVKHTDNFQKVLNLALQVAVEGNIVSIGIKPTYAATGYGYLKLSGEGEVLDVKKFIEKPNEEMANKLLAEGNVAWNAGIFIGSVEKFVKEFERLMPEMWKKVGEYFGKEGDEAAKIYGELENISIDYAIMEKLSDLKCVPGDFGWSDIGSWEEVVDDDGLKAEPTVEIDGGDNSFLGLFVEKKKSVFVGVNDLVVVDTPDAVLVMKKGAGQQVKKAVEAVRAISEEVTREHLFQERPWGRFENLRDEENCKVKKLILYPGKRISYQRHKFRSEHWVIVRGVAEIVLDDVAMQYEAGQGVMIEKGVKHRLANIGNEPLEVMEVQFGSYFGEDDIERFSDDFGRL